MPKDFARSQRVNVQLQRELAELIRVDLTDPRVVGVTVTRVSVSSDLRNAVVFVSLLGDEKALAQAIAALGGAAPRLQRALGRRLRLRRTPVLRFAPDDALREGDRIAGLIRNAVAEDHRHRPASENDAGGGIGGPVNAKMPPDDA